MSLHPILEDTEGCVQLLEDYYRGSGKFGLPRTGSHFDHWDGGGDRRAILNTLTADDFVAVSFLYVDVPPEASVALLGNMRRDVEILLEKIPHDKHLADLTTPEFESHLGPESPAQQLWDLLTGKHSYSWGIGATTASKIMARKRPRLIPITDTLVANLVGRTGNYWLQWHTALTDGSGLPDRLAAIRAKARIEQQPSPLRVLDIVLWMHARAADNVAVAPVASTSAP